MHTSGFYSRSSIRLNYSSNNKKISNPWPAAQTASAPVAARAAVTTAENTGNPSISVIGTFAGSSMRGGNGVRKNSFLPLSEGEFVFGAAVDAHTRLDVTVTAAGGGMAVEEGYITANLPAGFRLRAGRKFIPLGRANAVHPQALVRLSSQKIRLLRR